MSLTGLHDLYNLWHLYIRRFSFQFLDPFLDFNKLDVGFTVNKPDVGCRMSDFYKSDVGFLQVGCQIFKSRMPDVGFLQVGCRIFTSQMSDVWF